MSYKTVMLHINSHHPSTAAIRFAASIADKFDAHLLGSVPIGYPPMIAGDPYGGSGDYIQMMQEELEEAARQAKELFEKQCKELGVPSYEARVMMGSAIDATVLNAHYSDLVVLEQPDADARYAGIDFGFIGDVLLNIVRPVLMAPRASAIEPVLERVLIAWNGSNEAARAVSGALPFLLNANLVQVLVVNPSEDMGLHGEEPGADLAAYLARHGVSTDVRSLTVASDPAYAVFEQASEFGADMLVMGAYGHSRLREYILGGTTREVLGSMKMPVLMGH